jgi:hypothetical protein
VRGNGLGLLNIKELDGFLSINERLIWTMLASEKVELIEQPKQWIEKSKVAKFIFNAMLRGIGADVDQRQKTVAGRMNAMQDLQLRLWAISYYLVIKKTGHKTSKAMIAKKARELLLGDGFTPQPNLKEKLETAKKNRERVELKKRAKEVSKNIRESTTKQVKAINSVPLIQDTKPEVTRVDLEINDDKVAKDKKTSSLTDTRAQTPKGSRVHFGLVPSARTIAERWLDISL